MSSRSCLSQSSDSDSFDNATKVMVLVGTKVPKSPVVK